MDSVHALRRHAAEKSGEDTRTYSDLIARLAQGKTIDTDAAKHHALMARLRKTHDAMERDVSTFRSWYDAQARKEAHNERMNDLSKANEKQKAAAAAAKPFVDALESANNEVAEIRAQVEAGRADALAADHIREANPDLFVGANH